MPKRQQAFWRRKGENAAKIDENRSEVTVCANLERILQHSFSKKDTFAAKLLASAFL
jgi:hypothetical protein